MTTKIVPAGVFKQGCLALLDEVAEQNVELVVTKRGRPVARVVPILQPREQEAATLARLRARAPKPIGRDRDLLKPTSTLTRWKQLPHEDLK
jgi:antitoxin (DNA-binding transcriptional repressor) of toxin-antitoxin stability system